ncbi:MAG: GAF and HD-GYP domain-containing protein [Fimbriimonadales bacterium]
MIRLFKYSPLQIVPKKRRRVVLPPAEERLKSVLTASIELGLGTDLRESLLTTLRAAIKTTGASCGYVMLVEEEDGKKWLRAEVAFSADGPIDFPDRLEFGVGISGFVAKMGQTVAIADSEGEKQLYDGVTEGVKAGASTPLIMRTSPCRGRVAEDKVLGVLTLLSTISQKPFSRRQLELLKGFGAQISMALSNARMDAMRQETIIDTLSRIATALEARDRFFKGHSLRVSELGQRIAEKLGFDKDALDELRLGTTLLDMGKVYVPDTILNKKTPLTEDEFETLKQHTVRGYELCSRLGLSESVLMIIRNHHEKLDGSGYPDGLRGGELPLSLRIVCVADSFDAMISQRPHRDAMSLEQIISELSRVAGKHYDPLVVETMKLLNSSGMLRDLYSPPRDSEDHKEVA